MLMLVSITAGSTPSRLKPQAFLSQPVFTAAGAFGREAHVELLVDSLGLMQVWVWNARSELESIPEQAQATLRGGGGDQYRITLSADSASTRLVGRFEPHHFRIFDVELTLCSTASGVSFFSPTPREIPFHSHH